MEKDKPYINRYDHLYLGGHESVGLPQEGEELYPLQELITDTGLIPSGIFFPGLKKKIYLKINNQHSIKQANGDPDFQSK